MALSIAVNKLINEGLISESPFLDPIAAVSVGIVEGQALLDLCYVEDVAAEVDMNLVMTSTGNFIEVQGTGEEATFTADQLTQMLTFGKHGVDEVVKLQQAAIDAG